MKNKIVPAKEVVNESFLPEIITNFLKGNDLFLPSNTPIHERRVVVIGSQKTVDNMRNINWLELTKNLVIPYHFEYQFLKSLITQESFFDKFRKPAPPAFEIEMALREFKFPPQHPQDGVLYACSDMEPNLYIPLANFNKYLNDLKMTAFTKMCSKLGVKSCKILSSDGASDGSEVNVKVPKIKTPEGELEGEIKFNYGSKSEINSNLFFSLPAPTKIYPKYKSKWLRGEPTWKELRRMRMKHNANEWKVDFNYIDEFTIRGSFEAKLNDMGLNIGGKYENQEFSKHTFMVEFWPIEKLNVIVKKMNLFQRIWSWLFN